MHVTIECGDEGGYQRTEEMLTPLRRTTTSCVVMSSIAVGPRTPTVGTPADTTSLQAALVVVPVMLVFAAAGLTLVSRVLTQANGGVSGPNPLRRRPPGREDRRMRSR